MHVSTRLRSKFTRVFTHEQSDVLSDAIEEAYSDLVKTSDFNELKEIVRDIGIKVGELTEAQNRTEVRMEELAEAQKRTEIKVGELTEAQNRTEVRMEELTVALNRTEVRMEELTVALNRTQNNLSELVSEHKETRRQLGGISQAIGYGLEDRIMPFMADFVGKSYGLEANLVERRNITYPDGQFDEVNIYVEGLKNGKKAFVIGECKAQPGKKDVDKFHQMLDRLSKVLAGDVHPFLVGYMFHPEVEQYLRENYPNTGVFKSYEFELKYKRV